MLRSFSILQNPSSLRADSYLSALFEDKSRTYLAKLIARGDILLAWEPIEADEKLVPKDVIEISESTTLLDLKAQNAPIDTVFEHSDFLVINKDPFLNVHPVPGEGGNENTLVNHLLYHIQDLGTINGVMRPGIVHRLDKDTSGCLIVAKNDTAMSHIAQLIEQQKIRKTYLTLLAGHLSTSEMTIRSHIGRDPHHRKRMTSLSPLNPKEALSHFKLIEDLGSYQGTPLQLVEVELITGRTHQIRVHARSLQAPVLGDALYGRSDLNLWAQEHLHLKRQFLHAWKIEFDYMDTHYAFEAPLKPDLSQALEILRRGKTKL